MNLSAVEWSIELQHTPFTLRGDKVIFVAANAADAERATLRAFSLGGRELWSRTFEEAMISGMETLEVSKTSRVLLALSSADLLHGEGMILALNDDGE